MAFHNNTTTKGGVDFEVEVVVSNIGPHATVGLAGRGNFDDGYLALLERDVHPTANIVFNIASRDELMKAPGIITFGAGMLAATLIPVTDAERRLGQQVKDNAGEVTDKVKDVASEMKDDLSGTVQQAAGEVKATAQDAAQTTKQQAQSSAQDAKEQVQQTAS